MLTEVKPLKTGRYLFFYPPTVYFQDGKAFYRMEYKSYSQSGINDSTPYSGRFFSGTFNTMGEARIAGKRMLERLRRDYGMRLYA